MKSYKIGLFPVHAVLVLALLSYSEATLAQNSHVHSVASVSAHWRYGTDLLSFGNKLLSGNPDQQSSNSSLGGLTIWPASSSGTIQTLQQVNGTQVNSKAGTRMAIIPGTNFLVVSAPGIIGPTPSQRHGAIRVYDISGASPTFLSEYLMPSGDDFNENQTAGARFGASLAALDLGSVGKVIAVGAPWATRQAPANPCWGYYTPQIPGCLCPGVPNNNGMDGVCQDTDRGGVVLYFANPSNGDLTKIGMVWNPGDRIQSPRSDAPDSFGENLTVGFIDGDTLPDLVILDPYGEHRHPTSTTLLPTEDTGIAYILSGLSILSGPSNTNGKDTWGLTQILAPKPVGNARFGASADYVDWAGNPSEQEPPVKLLAISSPGRGTQRIQVFGGTLSPDPCAVATDEGPLQEGGAFLFKVGTGSSVDNFNVFSKVTGCNQTTVAQSGIVNLVGAGVPNTGAGEKIAFLDDGDTLSLLVGEPQIVSAVPGNGRLTKFQVAPRSTAKGLALDGRIQDSADLAELSNAFGGFSSSNSGNLTIANGVFALPAITNGRKNIAFNIWGDLKQGAMVLHGTGPAMGYANGLPPSPSQPRPLGSNSDCFMSGLPGATTTPTGARLLVEPSVSQPTVKAGSPLKFKVSCPNCSATTTPQLYAIMGFQDTELPIYGCGIRQDMSFGMFYLGPMTSSTIDQVVLPVPAAGIDGLQIVVNFVAYVGGANLILSSSQLAVVGR